jgi:8-oxo-dGTP pyrophosphatase MutT (NUDIX family)
MPPCGLDVAATTSGQPFCAGVILMLEGQLVTTLNHDHLPAGLEGTALRVGGVGGGQEPGETIWECAAREALEEVGCEVELIRSPRTYLRETPDGVLRQARCRDEVAPLLFEWAERSDPAPYAPGLPAGSRLYGAMFFGRPASPDLRPADVDGLLLMPSTLWRLVDREATIRETVEAGATLIERERIEPDLRLWSYPQESMRAVCELATRSPELLAPLR